MFRKKKKRTSARKFGWPRLNPRTAGPFAVTLALTLSLMAAMYQIAISAKSSFDEAAKALGETSAGTSRTATPFDPAAAGRPWGR